MHTAWHTSIKGPRRVTESDIRDRSRGVKGSEKKRDYFGVFSFRLYRKRYSIYSRLQRSGTIMYFLKYVNFILVLIRTFCCTVQYMYTVIADSDTRVALLSTQIIISLSCKACANCSCDLDPSSLVREWYKVSPRCRLRGSRQPPAFRFAMMPPLMQIRDLAQISYRSHPTRAQIACGPARLWASPMAQWPAPLWPPVS